MYILFLLLIAFFFISIFSVNWPLKLYHHYLLSKLADALGVVPEQNSLFLNIYSQINTVYNGNNLKIRFVDGSIDSLKANQGLEIRLRWQSGFLMEFYRLRQNKREWGDFQHFVTGEKAIDSEWFILTDNQAMAADLWKGKSEEWLHLLNDHSLIHQILISKNEIIVQLKRFHSNRAIVSLLGELSKILES